MKYRYVQDGNFRYLDTDRPKKYFHLWFEFLRRSQKYKKICDWYKDNPNEPFPHKTDKTIQIEKNYIVMGDVFNKSFDEWYSVLYDRLEWNRVLREGEVIKKYKDVLIQNILDAKSMLQKRSPKQPTIDDLVNHFQQGNFFEEDHYVLNPNVLDPSKTIDVIEKRIGKIRKTSFIKGLERYLKAYDLQRLEGKKRREVVESIKPNSSGDIDNDVRDVNKDVSAAEQIIKNVENGIFPGKYKR